MSIVELLDEHDYSDEVRTWDKKVREYTRAPAMTPYVKAAAHHLPYMASEHIYVMPTRKLRRQLKETIAVAVSMVNNCRYCIVAHARLLSKMFSVTDAELVELTSAVAHISGLNRFETAILSGG